MFRLFSVALCNFSENEALKDLSSDSYISEGSFSEIFNKAMSQIRQAKFRQ